MLADADTLQDLTYHHCWSLILIFINVPIRVIINPNYRVCEDCPSALITCWPIRRQFRYISSLVDQWDDSILAVSTNDSTVLFRILIVVSSLVGMCQATAFKLSPPSPSKLVSSVEWSPYHPSDTGWPSRRLQLIIPLPVYSSLAHLGKYFHCTCCKYKQDLMKYFIIDLFCSKISHEKHLIDYKIYMKIFQVGKYFRVSFYLELRKWW